MQQSTTITIIMAIIVIIILFVLCCCFYCIIKRYLTIIECIFGCCCKILGKKSKRNSTKKDNHKETEHNDKDKKSEKTSENDKSQTQSNYNNNNNTSLNNNSNNNNNSIVTKPISNNNIRSNLCFWKKYNHNSSIQSVNTNDCKRIKIIPTNLNQYFDSDDTSDLSDIVYNHERHKNHGLFSNHNNNISETSDIIDDSDDDNDNVEDTDQMIRISQINNDKELKLKLNEIENLLNKILNDEFSTILFDINYRDQLKSNFINQNDDINKNFQMNTSTKANSTTIASVNNHANKILTENQNDSQKNLLIKLNNMNSDLKLVLTDLKLLRNYFKTYKFIQKKSSLINIKFHHDDSENELFDSNKFCNKNNMPIKTPIIASTVETVNDTNSADNEKAIKGNEFINRLKNIYEVNENSMKKIEERKTKALF